MKRHLITTMPLVILLELCAFGQTPADGEPSSVPTVGDTKLDIMGSFVSATLLGCKARKNDQVLINGHPPDPSIWDNPVITPATDTPDVGKYANTRRPLASISPVVRFRIESGYYLLTVTVGHCESLPTPLIASGIFSRNITLWTRNVASPPNASVTILTTAGLCGTIPLGDLQVMLVSPDNQTYFTGRDIPSRDTDNFGYFIDDAKPGRYRLFVRGYAWSEDLGTVDLTKVGLYVRHISVDELGLYPIGGVYGKIPPGLSPHQGKASSLWGPVQGAPCT